MTLGCAGVLAGGVTVAGAGGFATGGSGTVAAGREGAGMGIGAATFGGTEATAGGGGAAALGGAFGAAAGNGVPQNPQNLLPAGKLLWHFGQITCCNGCVAAGREMGTVSAVGSGFPHRAQVAEAAGLGVPHDGQRP